MTVAILVLGYREPSVLAAVVPVYRKAGFDIYVHLDAKASVVDYALAMGDQAQYCRFIQPRTPVFWAGFTMTQATMQLLETALGAKDYTNLALVSDDTLPIVPIARLRTALTTRVERIAIRLLQAGDVFLRRYQEFFYLDHAATSLLGRPIETACIDQAFIETFARLLARRRAGKVDLPLYYGSQWWCLTGDAARRVLSLHADRTDLRESFEFSAVPDEMYIQTLVANFAQANGIVQGPVYVDWTQTPKPFVFSRIEQFSNAVSPDHLFVRKVSSQTPDFIKEAIRRIQ
ncbi:beta-1,6-N-acetylglucosaminyltransferase [Dankookia sp. GCM10030260]|uniref:beta-1,6-N-acetylglucosaminyltransferase n=1 Tax=Dankookia sp. GCM10030260 TaxID=3273390 RepID=UPI003620A3AA